MPYDQKYALRLCSELPGLEKACVHIYTTMGLYEEAVDLALQVLYIVKMFYLLKITIVLCTVYFIYLLT